MTRIVGMKMKRNIAYLGMTMMSLMSNQSFATLGEPSASILKDRTALNAGAFEMSDSNPLYQVVSYQTQSVTLIREYIAKDGTVFAVSWDGPLKPNLQQLLGRHYATLTAAITSKPHAGRTPVYINRRDIVVESNGHARSFFGLAYLPAVMPAGVKVSDIQISQG